MACAELFFKCENFQKMGAFKMRGATNAVFSLPGDLCSHGVATHSSGNFAQALALAAGLRGIKATIVMPSNAPKAKKDAVQGYGARIVECEPTLEARESTLAKVVNETGAVFIHPFNDYRVIEGHASCALEMIEEIENPDFIVVPVGGGGLISGIALAYHFLSPKTFIIGAEPEGAPDAHASMIAGNIIPQTNPQTIADGLRTSLGDKTFFIIREHVCRIELASDKEIIDSMRLIWERMKIIVEPSSAVTLAVVLKNRDFFQNKRIGIVLSGGNVDLSNLPF